jgi:hypothetical protein
MLASSSGKVSKVSFIYNKNLMDKAKQNPKNRFELKI